MKKKETEDRNRGIEINQDFPRSLKRLSRRSLLLGSEVAAVVNHATLSHCSDDRDVVGGGSNRTHPVGSGDQTPSDDGGRDTTNIRIVKTLEEHERVRVGNTGIGKAGDGLDGDVRVAFDQSGTVDLLGARVVIGRGVGEDSVLNALDTELNGEILIGGDGAEVRRELELEGRGVDLGRDLTHGYRITAPINILQTVGDRLTDAGVDIVVFAGDGGGLACGRNSRLLDVGADLAREKRQRVLGVGIVLCRSRDADGRSWRSGRGSSSGVGARACDGLSSRCSRGSRN